MTRDPESKKPDDGNAAATRDDGPPPPSGSEIVRGAAAQDDRNLVAIEKDFDFEDRIWFYWQKYRGWVLATVVALFLAVLAVTGYSAWQTSQQEALEAGFQEATTNEARLEFGRANVDSALGGVALLQVAHSTFAERDWETAAAQYAEAKEALRQTQFFGVARLGEAMSYLKQGDAELARANLESIFRDPVVLNSIRREAGFHLGTLFLGEGDFVNARTTFLSLRDIGVVPNTPWKAAANELLQGHPELISAEIAEQATRARATQAEQPSASAPTQPEVAPAPAPSPAEDTSATVSQILDEVIEEATDPTPAAEETPTQATTP
ncbi:MAG: tetratricopeptide repeat protein [Opitutales bacterium]